MLPPPTESLDHVLDVAVDVLRDYGDDPGNTRLERLARWVVAYLGGPPYAPESAAGSIARFAEGGMPTVLVVGEHARVEMPAPGTMNSEGVLMTVVALVRAHEQMTKED